MRMWCPWSHGALFPVKWSKDSKQARRESMLTLPALSQLCVSGQWPVNWDLDPGLSLRNQPIPVVCLCKAGPRSFSLLRLHLFPCQRDLHPVLLWAGLWCSPFFQAAHRHSSSFTRIHCLWVTKDRFALRLTLEEGGTIVQQQNSPGFSRLTLLSLAKWLVTGGFLPNCFLVVQTKDL